LFQYIPFFLILLVANVFFLFIFFFFVAVIAAAIAGGRSGGGWGRLLEQTVNVIGSDDLLRLLAAEAINQIIR
jgi:hypothetical protein